MRPGRSQTLPHRWLPPEAPFPRPVVLATRCALWRNRHFRDKHHRHLQAFPSTGQPPRHPSLRCRAAGVASGVCQFQGRQTPVGEQLLRHAALGGPIRVTQQTASKSERVKLTTPQQARIATPPGTCIFFFDSTNLDVNDLRLFQPRLFPTAQRYHAPTPTCRACLIAIKLNLPVVAYARHAGQTRGRSSKRPSSGTRFRRMEIDTSAWQPPCPGKMASSTTSRGPAVSGVSNHQGAISAQFL